jgi:hypothetical protein
VGDVWLFLRLPGAGVKKTIVIQRFLPNVDFSRPAELSTSTSML